MSLIDYALLGLILAAVIAAVRFQLRRRRGGCTGCCGSCGGCSGCNRREKQDK